MTSPQLPIGIRNNNPGNLRQAYGMSFKTELREGFAVFPTMRFGCQSLALLSWDYYQLHKLKTLPDFIARYAPASENDVQAYIKNMAWIMGIPENMAPVYDLRLDIPGHCLTFMRAIARVENGAPPRLWANGESWATLATWHAAMVEAGHWGQFI